METTLLVEAASQAGVSGAAMVDALARGQTYFAAKEPNAENLTAWVAQLKQDAGHLFTPPASGPGTSPAHLPPAWLTPEEKMNWARTHTPQAPVQRRPGRYTATAEDLKALEGKSPQERLTFGHDKAAQQAHGGPA